MACLEFAYPQSESKDFQGRRPWKTALFLGIIFILFLGTMPALASPKKAYLKADTAYKRLRLSAVKRQKISEWLSCIKQYENIYIRYPESSWAPAGMYKAVELYLKLHKLSKNKTYQTRALDLAARITKKYPASAYAGRVKKLRQRIPHTIRVGKKLLPKTPKGKPKEKKERQRPNRPRSVLKKSIGPKKLKSKASYLRSKKPSSPLKPVRMAPPKKNSKKTGIPPAKDAKITDLRFWSNPEYTRIVINADQTRKVSYGLLKKDPKHNVSFQRLYLDIPKSRLGKGVPEHTLIDDHLLKQARAAQYRPHVVRVVMDLKSFESYKVFSLQDPFRIVVDVWQKGSKKMAVAPPPPTTTISTDNLKSSDIARQLALGVRKIVIDPGHGGPDPGAPGYIKGVWEKDIVLKLAIKLAKKLRERLNCTVLLTRSTDKKLTLEERTAIANTQRADLFISLHSNAARNRKLKGFETYILNLATDEQAIAVAARENATSEKNISDLEFILSDLMKHAKIEESRRLAQDVQSNLVNGMRKKYKDIKDLGVKQAPFYVLLGARMPAILVETSFLSNKMECKRLMTATYQNYICEAITNGVEKYIRATNPRKLKSN